jgi:hypothetical protein
VVNTSEPHPIVGELLGALEKGQNGLRFTEDPRLIVLHHLQGSSVAEARWMLMDIAGIGHFLHENAAPVASRQVLKLVELIMPRLQESLNGGGEERWSKARRELGIDALDDEPSGARQALAPQVSSGFSLRNMGGKQW